MKKRLYTALWRTPHQKKTFLFALVSEDDWEPDDDCDELAMLLLGMGEFFNPATDDFIVAPLHTESLPSLGEEVLQEYLLEIRCPEHGHMYVFHNA